MTYIPAQTFQETPYGEVVHTQRTSKFSLDMSRGVSALRDTVTLNGTGLVTSASNEILLSTGASALSSVQMQTKSRCPFSPGFELENGVAVRVPVMPSGTQRGEWGYLDSNDGFGFGVDASGSYILIRSSGSADSRIYQSSWNCDPLNGSGSSGLNFQNWVSGTAGYIHFTTHGYGSVEFKISTYDPNVKYKRHVTAHIAVPTTGALIKNHALPITISASNGSGGGNFSLYGAGRSMVKFGPENGTHRYPLADVVNKTVAVSSGTYTPLMSIRKKTTFLGNPNSYEVELMSVELMTNQDVQYRVYYGTTLVSASFASPSTWSSTETAVEHDVSAVSFTGGQVVESGFVTALKNETSNIDEHFSLYLNSDIVTLAARAITTQATVNAIVHWKEDW